jgi:2-alkenal reductase
MMLSKRFATLVIAIFVIAGAAIALPAAAQNTQSEISVPQADTVAATVYDTVSPSVVAINVYRTAQAPTAMQLNPFGSTEPFGSRNQTPPEVLQAGSGSGFVLDTEGHIVTNAHVVENAQRIEVNFFNGVLAKAQVVGLDNNSDIAVLKVDVDPSMLAPVTFADSDLLDIGERVLAIGSPFGQRWTITEGIISGLQRTISGLTQFSIGGVIQTDAAINPGNSGGPLLNTSGQVIGVNSQISTASGSFSGVGYAVPSNLVQRVARELIERGYVEYSYLGIRGGDVNLAVIEALELPNTFKGVIVSEATQGGPAARAGLQSAADFTTIDGLSVPTTVDIITAVNGTPLSGIADLITYLATETKPGDTVTLEVLRNGSETLTIEARLTPRPVN